MLIQPMTMLAPDDEARSLAAFRRVATTYEQRFLAMKNNVGELLGARHNYESGLYREALLRDFLRELLPKSLEVSSGFIYGFERVPTSGQIDVLVWDAARYSPVYRTPDFVIVPPESVVCAISVKSDLRSSRTVKGAMRNLASVCALDLAYRSQNRDNSQPPILKVLFGYHRGALPSSISEWIADYFRCELAGDRYLTEPVVRALRGIDPVSPSEEHAWAMERTFPKMTICIGDEARSFLQGWGPPDDVASLLSSDVGGARWPRTYGPCGLTRVPYLYEQRGSITSPFEKFVYYVLAAAHRFVGARGHRSSMRGATLTRSTVFGLVTQRR